MWTPDHTQPAISLSSRVLLRLCKSAASITGLALILTACGGGGGKGPYMQGAAGFMAQKKPPADIIMFAPLSGRDQRIGTQMANAARLALPGATSQGLAIEDESVLSQSDDVALAVLDRGQKLQLGPLRASHAERAESLREGAMMPTLAFTSNDNVARPTMWVMGVTPAQQVAQLVDAAQKREKRSKFAAFLPDSALGHALGDALTRACATSGLAAPTLIFHDGTEADIKTRLGDLLKMAPQKVDAPKAMEVAANSIDSEPDAIDPTGESAANETGKLAGASGKVPGGEGFDALLLGDTGLTLQTDINVLASSDADLKKLRLMGPALWRGFSAKLGKLGGAWFAAPDPSFRRGFVAKYRARYGVEPSILADVAYDSAALAGAMMREGGVMGAASLTRATGFAGVDGIFALKPDGTVRRGLAVFEILPLGGFKMAFPAPRRFDESPATPSKSDISSST